MSDGLFLESVEGLESAPIREGALWELLQSEKEQLCRELCAAGSIAYGNGYSADEREPADDCAEVIGWRRRDQLESRLRELLDAQDRLVDGCYGRCEECGRAIDERRLAADPATTLCFACQIVIEPEVIHHTM